MRALRAALRRRCETGGRIRALVSPLALAAALTIVLDAGANAQEPGPPPAPPPPPAPTLQIVAADLRQLGGDLQLRLRFSRPLPVAQLQPARGRIICMVLSPDAPSRRRVCARRRDGRLIATMAAVGPDGRVVGGARAVRGAVVRADGDALELRADAESLRVRLGRTLRWFALVSWKDGGLCTVQPDPAACTQRLPATGTQALRTRAPRRPAFARRGRLRLLATGDSMIQILDGHLDRRLEPRRGTTVRSDAHISTGISKPSLLNWVSKARTQAHGFKPDVTVMFIGANDGFPMRTAAGADAPCCDAAWVAEYARRTAKMMRSYRRGGRSFVYWLTLPAPRRDDYARIYRQVNRAIRRAADDVGEGVRVIDLVKVFTPGGRFRQTIRFRGRRVDARQADGIHLSVAGAAVAATLVIDRLRADRALP